MLMILQGGNIDGDKMHPTNFYFEIGLNNDLTLGIERVDGNTNATRTTLASGRQLFRNYLR